MKKYAADNLMFLRQHYPELYNTIRNQTYDQSKFCKVYARNGQANLLIMDESNKEKTLYSRYNPQEEVHRWLESLNERVREAKHVLFFGFGFGYHIDAFAKSFPEKKIYIYEPEINYFMVAIESLDLRTILENKQISIFAIGKDPAIQVQLLESIYRVIEDSFAFISIPIYQNLHNETFQEFEKNIQISAMGYQSNLQTISNFQLDWTENIILNMEKMLSTYPFAPLKNSCVDIPAVVVGSGPSLEMELETLRKLKNRVLIIAAGSSIQALLRNQIEPDLVVSVDPGEPNFKVFHNLDVKDIPFLFVPNIKHSIVDRELPYLMHAVLNNDPITHYLMDYNSDDLTFLSTATVSGIAIQAAIYLNSSEIVFIGQDFSFPNDRYYSEGIVHDEQIENKVASSDRTVLNVRGGFNRTNHMMQVLKSSVETVIDIFTYSNYYNASQIGAKIKGTKTKTLAQLYDERKDYDLGEDWFKKKISGCLQKYSSSKVESVIRRIKDTFNEIEELNKTFDMFKKHILQLNELKKNNDKEVQAWYNEFDRYWDTLSNYKVFKYIYSFILQRELNYLERRWADIVNEPQLDTKFEMLKDYINPLLDGIKKVTPVVNDTFKKLINRLDAKK